MSTWTHNWGGSYAAPDVNGKKVNVPPKPDGKWEPDTSGAQGGDPWNEFKGSLPPFPPPPKVPGGIQNPGKGINVISVEAIRIYANNLEAMLPVIEGIIRELDDLATSGFGAGTFGAANNFKTKVFGGGNGQGGATLLASTREVFVQARTIFLEFVARCREIAKKYKTAAELSELDAKEFLQMVGTVKNKVENLPLGAAS